MRIILKHKSQYYLYPNDLYQIYINIILKSGFLNLKINFNTLKEISIKIVKK